MKELCEETQKWLKDNVSLQEGERFVHKKGSDFSDENYVEIAVPNLLASREDRIKKLPNVQTDEAGDFQDALKS